MVNEPARSSDEAREKGQRTVKAPTLHEKDIENLSSSDGTLKEPLREGGLIAWGVVFGAFLANFITFGVANVNGIFLQAYLHDSTSPFQSQGSFRLSFVIGIALGLSFVGGPFSNLLVTKFGVRAPVMLGVFSISVAFEMASLAKEYWQLFLSQGVLWGLGASLVFIPSIGLPSQFFTRRKGLATGLAASGSAVGAMILSPSLQAAINSISIPWALRILGFVELGAGILCVALLRQGNSEKNNVVKVQYKSFDVKVLQTRAYPLYLVYAFMQMFGYITPIYWLPNYAGTIGLTSQQGSNIITILAAGNFVGRLVSGFIADRLGVINILSSFTFVAGLLCVVVWIFARSYGVLIVFGLLWGFFSGAYWSLTVPATAKIVGQERLGSAVSLNFLMNVIPPVFASSIGSGLIEATSRFLNVDQNQPEAYRYLIVWSGLIYMVPALLLIAVRFQLTTTIWTKV